MLKLIRERFQNMCYIASYVMKKLPGRKLFPHHRKWAEIAHLLENGSSDPNKSTQEIAK